MLSIHFDVNKMVANVSFLNVIFKIVFFLRRIHKVTLISRYRSTPDEFKFKTASIINATWNNKSSEIFFLISKNGSSISTYYLEMQQ